MVQEHCEVDHAQYREHNFSFPKKSGVPSKKALTAGDFFQPCRAYGKLRSFRGSQWYKVKELGVAVLQSLQLHRARLK